MNSHVRLIRWFFAFGLWVGVVSATWAQTFEVELPLSGPALHMTEQAENALAVGDVNKASMLAAEAWRLRSDDTRVKALRTALRQAQRTFMLGSSGKRADSLSNKRVRKTVLLRAVNANPSGAGLAPVAVDRAAAAQVQQVYDLIAQQQAAQAVQMATDLLRDRPDDKQRRVAYVNALFAAGDLTRADEIAQELVKRFPLDDDLLILRETLRRQLSDASSYKAYRALEDEDFPSAAKAARDAVKYAPDVMDNRILLVQIHMQAKQFAEATNAASEAIDLDPEDPLPWVLRGFNRQSQGDRAGALADFSHVLKRLEYSKAEEKMYRLVMVDAALAAHEPETALDLLKPLQSQATAPIEPMLLWRQRAVKLQQMEREAGKEVALMPLSPLGFDCRISPYGRECALLPAGLMPDPAYLMAAKAYEALAARQFDQAKQHANWAVILNPDNLDYADLLVNCLEEAGDFAAADLLLTDRLGKDAVNGKTLARRGQLRERFGNKQQALQDYTQALALGDLTMVQSLPLMVKVNRKNEARELLQTGLQNGEHLADTPLALAYLALQVGADELALSSFDQSDTNQPLKAANLQDAAQAAVRLRKDKQALTLLKRVVDDLGGEPRLDLRESQALASLDYARRQITELSRVWGANWTASYRGALPGYAGGGAVAAADKSLQIGAELYWRPDGYRNGELLELFARTYHTPYNEAGGLTGRDSLQGSAGVRWRPSLNSNTIFVLSHQFPVGSKMNSEWLAQVAYSDGEGGELRTTQDDWASWQLYAEAGRYLVTPQTFAAGSLRWGHSYRLSALSPTLVAFPHVVLAGDFNDTYTNPTSVGLGVGLHMRYWFRQDTYHAPRSYVDFTLQQRAGVHGDAQRSKGTFLTFQVAY